MVQPTQLLQNLGVVRIILNNFFISHLSSWKIALLLVDVPDLEPYVGMCERIRRVSENPIKTLQAVAIFAALLVDNPKSEKNLV